MVSDRYVISSFNKLSKFGNFLNIISESCKKKHLPCSGKSFNHFEIKKGLTVGI